MGSLGVCMYYCMLFILVPKKVIGKAIEEPLGLRVRIERSQIFNISEPNFISVWQVSSWVLFIVGFNLLKILEMEYSNFNLESYSGWWTSAVSQLVQN